MIFSTLFTSSSCPHYGVLSTSNTITHKKKKNWDFSAHNSAKQHSHTARKILSKFSPYFLGLCSIYTCTTTIVVSNLCVMKANEAEGGGRKKKSWKHSIAQKRFAVCGTQKHRRERDEKTGWRPSNSRLDRKSRRKINSKKNAEKGKSIHKLTQRDVNCVFSTHRDRAEEKKGKWRPTDSACLGYDVEKGSLWSNRTWRRDCLYISGRFVSLSSHPVHDFISRVVRGGWTVCVENIKVESALCNANTRDSWKLGWREKRERDNKIKTHNLNQTAAESSTKGILYSFCHFHSRPGT